MKTGIELLQSTRDYQYKIKMLDLVIAWLNERGIVLDHWIIESINQDDGHWFVQFTGDNPIHYMVVNWYEEDVTPKFEVRIK